jgi:hypothetical protein
MSECGKEVNIEETHNGPVDPDHCIDWEPSEFDRGAESQKKNCVDDLVFRNYPFLVSDILKILKNLFLLMSTNYGMLEYRCIR